jgi:hypothetical protein
MDFLTSDVIFMAVTLGGGQQGLKQGVNEG